MYRKKIRAILAVLVICCAIAACGSAQTGAESIAGETSAAETAAESEPFSNEAAETAAETEPAAPEAVEYKAGGIAAVFPAAWKITKGDVSLAAVFRSEERSGAMKLMTAAGADPAKLAGEKGEAFAKTYGEREFSGVTEEVRTKSGDEETSVYHMTLYAAFDDTRSLQISVALRDASLEQYQAFLDDGEFVSVMESMVLDPAGCPAAEAAEAEGIVSERGAVTGYDGKAEELEIPAAIGDYTIDTIQAGAFQGNTDLRSVVIPEGVTWIQAGAFEGCSNLEQVVFPGTLLEIGQNAFRDCRNLREIELPDSVRSIGAGAFSEMGGLIKVHLPEGLEEIPENCFDGTMLDVLVIPASVTKIADHATYGAAAIVIQNPEAEIGARAICADYIFLKDASKCVFPTDHEIMVGSRLYLDGIYDPAQIQGKLFKGTTISSQIYLPADATEAQCNAMDAYLASIGYPEIAWMGGAENFLPENTFWFEMDGNVVTGYIGDSQKLSLADYVLYFDGDFWFTVNIYGVADEAFKDSKFTEAYFRGNFGDKVGSRILEGNTDLKDLWFTTQILFDGENYAKDTFEGIPADVTVHLPASLTAEQRSRMEEFLHGIGVPASAAFDYYTLR